MFINLLASMAALLWATPLHADHGYLPDYTTDKVKYEAWFNACVYTQYSCQDTALPKVVSKNLREGLLGTYKGGDTIIIRRGLRGNQLKEVLMHEMVHYLQAVKGGLVVPGPAKEICAAEAEAFASVDDWLIDERLWSLVVGPNWWIPYDHCHQWYDPDFPVYGDPKTNINIDLDLTPSGRF